MRRQLFSSLVLIAGQLTHDLPDRHREDLVPRLYRKVTTYGPLLEDDFGPSFMEIVYSCVRSS